MANIPRFSTYDTSVEHYDMSCYQIGTDWKQVRLYMYNTKNGKFLRSGYRRTMKTNAKNVWSYVKPSEIFPNIVNWEVAVLMQRYKLDLTDVVLVEVDDKNNPMFNNPIPYKP